MDVKRNYYTQALAQDPDEGVTEEMKKNLWKFLEQMEEKERQRIMDPEKEKWFRGLEEGVLSFAETCDLNVRMWIDAAKEGHIHFETSYFSLGYLEGMETVRFWHRISQNGELTIIHREETFVIELRYALYQKS